MTRTVLAIDTATAAVIAGVLRRDDDGGLEVLAERTALGAQAHAELLTPTVLAAADEAGVALAALDAVVVGCGPGPFTGLRVGMATAAAYGHALGVPVHGVCSLDAIGVQTRGAVLVVTDARRREVYWARYRDGLRVAGPGVAAAGDVDTDGADAIAGSPEHCGLFNLPRTAPERPSAVGLVAAVANWAGAPDPLVPLYLRRPDAKTLAERGVDR
ncbi:MAG: tRNA (adenosine(37)-N6)-threonylcarbamoyltransferase complex dimerization subunit type 1 TsaB [Mycobacterium sp.]|nr:tRNA (adenosine(37)-N6)-threonylcarbamoyltransferase complex dimerization subunit type 1 TsaB [Mycobacterium sp.]